ncbi:MAG TPA: PHP domain-containing protein [Bacillota bacterium]|jgi:putative hydrolase|nr:PHP domain-containing protein [Bacillota bacterium]HOL08854.1 PHP domain-containing protein [Bacillota bacterium]HPO96547.1 PHP domain-containing protein [Bacillota bacterium]
MWKVFADYHTHTKYSHGAGAIIDNVIAAKQRGLEEIGIADHGPANWGHVATSGLEAFEQIIAETEKIRQEISGIKILAGTEANIISYKGELDIPLELQRKLDQVLAGFHVTVHPKTFNDGFRYVSEWALSKLSPSIRRKARNNNTKAIVEAVYNNEIDIITHPGLNISIDTVELARACVQNNTVLEINSKHGIKSIEFIKTAAREGVKFAIGSDAHTPEKVGHLEEGLKAAQVAGLTLEQLINVREEG